MTDEKLLNKMFNDDCCFNNSGMPNVPFLYAMDFIEVLKKKHAAGTYKDMVKICFFLPH